jgi:soluble lytic murein transglycosylase
MKFPALYLGALGFLIAGTAFAAGTDSDAGKQAFVQAMQRITLRQPDAPDPPALRSYAIYEYLVAARLRRDINLHPDEELDRRVDAFLKDQGSRPVTRNLKREWLHSLAQRNRWDWFFPRALDQSDPQLACERLAGRLATDDTATLVADALPRFSLPQRQPTQCNPVFNWLRLQGAVTPDLIESRVRASLRADNPHFARDLTADLSGPLVKELLNWADLLEMPRLALTSLAAHPTTPIDADTLALSFDKLARSDAAAAFGLLPQLLARGDMNPALAARLRRSVALAAAYDHDSRAIAAFEQLPLEAVDALVQEWRVRAALWEGDFVRTREWIEQMPPELSSLPRWRYWRARAIATLEGEVAALPLFTELAQLRDYYGYLAADRLHLPYQLNSHASPDDVGTQLALASEPAVLRAHELFECDQGDDASVEWNVALASAGNGLKVQAAHLAARWGWYVQAITTLAQTGEFDDVPLRYPRPFPELVEEAAKLSRLPPEWIYAVMRQESLFRVDAVSHADARGLMQMQPATAALVARRWRMKPPSRDALFEPAVAIPLGSAHLRDLLDRYGGNLALTLAAYNAGPGAVERWQPHKNMSADVWLENVPYNETRGYVQHILEHMVAFAHVADVPPPSVSLPPL